MIETPDKGFIDELQRYRKRKPSVTFVVERDVVAPVLFRNSNEERAETSEINQTLHAQVNGEKFVSKERLTGLDLLRRLTDEFAEDSWDDKIEDEEIPDALISDEHTYNEPGPLAASMNLDTLVYGGAGTGGQEYSIKSRVIEGYTYSLHEYDLMRRETRNAVYESGTMQDEDGEQSSSLYEYSKIHPDNKFLHFITLESGKPGMFLYVLHNILNTVKYGARETRTGKAIENNILGLIVGKHNTNLSTNEYLKDYYEDDFISNLEAYIEDNKTIDWDVYGDEFESFQDFPEWFVTAREIAARKKEGADQILYETFFEETEEGLEMIV